MSKFLLILMSFWVSIIQTYAKKPTRAYAIFNNHGEEVSFEKLLNASLESELVFFGELHNNPISHWLALKLIKSFRQSTARQIIVGMEMFEADNQLLLDEYLEGIISEKNFEEEAKLWSNYKTDYKPLVMYCKKEKIPIIATNIPRRYAAMVSRKGFEALDSLSSEAKKYLPPLPVPFNSELASYKTMISMGMGSSKALPHIEKAQAVKDATMAYFILKNMKDRGLFFHINGAYHTDHREGIVWYVTQSLKNIPITVITTQIIDSWEDINKIDFTRADYTLVVEADVSPTY